MKRKFVRVVIVGCIFLRWTYFLRSKYNIKKIRLETFPSTQNPKVNKLDLCPWLFNTNGVLIWSNRLPERPWGFFLLFFCDNDIRHSSIIDWKSNMYGRTCTTLTLKVKITTSLYFTIWWNFRQTVKDYFSVRY